MKRALVTGASGFIGRHSLPALIARGYEVHAVTGPDDPTTDERAVWHRIDLLNASETAALLAEIRPSHLLHFAWYVAPGKYLSSVENLLWVSASMRLMLEFARHGGQRAVCAGTCFEYDASQGVCKDVGGSIAPGTLYGTCKHAVGSIALGYAGQAGISAAWGRIFFLYGPHEHPHRLVSGVIRSLLNGQTAKCSHGRQVRDFLHVQDVAEAFVALLESSATGAVNIGAGEPVAINDVIGRIGRIIGRSDLIALGALPGREDEPPLLIADVHRLRDEVGFAPSFTLDEGLAQTIQWWRDNPRRQLPR